MRTSPTTIRRRLVTVMMLTSTVVLLLTGTVLVVYEAISYRQAIVRGVTVRAAILADNSTAALAFGNTEDAGRVLGTLKTDPAVIAAALYDRQGRLFAGYPDDASSIPPAQWSDAASHRFEASGLVVLQPVIENGRRLGTLYLNSSLNPLYKRLQTFALVVVFAIIGCVGVAFALSTWLQRGIAGPVRLLAETARDVSRRKDYSVRANVASNDELGLLTEAFNEMLGTIQQRDAALGTSEARLRAILESALDCIVTMDHEGRVVEFNPAAETLFGHTRVEVMGTNLADLLVPPALRARGLDGLARCLTPGDGVVLDRRIEGIVMTAGGRECSVELALTRVHQDREPMFTGFIRDITDRKRAEQEIQQLNSDLERRVSERTAQFEILNRELEAFSYSVSHDLRAPLRHVSGFAEMLHRHSAQSLDEKGQRYLGLISDSALRMGQLIDDLLTFSRMGRDEMAALPVDLNELIRGVRQSIEGETAEREVLWRVAPLPVVHGDPAMLRLVFTNLISNAIKYSSTRARSEVTIESEASATEIILRVRDNGVGFDMAHASKLFGVFQRLHSSEEFEGTGIGLANVRRIVHRHGGRTWAESEPNQGATFFISLPRQVPVEGRDQREAA